MDAMNVRITFIEETKTKGLNAMIDVYVIMLNYIHTTRFLQLM